MPFDPEPYAAGLRRRESRRRRQIAEDAARAREEAVRLARAIGEADDDVRMVYLFGSLAAGEPGREDFDIDLAIDGGDVYAAEARAETSPFSVDLVDLSRLPAATAGRIRAGGTVLYSRDSTGAGPG